MFKATLALVGGLAITTSASAAVEWHPWAVHEGTISNVGGVITAYTPDTNYRWNKPNPPTRDGAKAYYSTDAFFGQQIEDITQITWTVDSGAAGNAYYNIVVDDGTGKKGILIPAVNAALVGTASGWGAAGSYTIVETDAGFSVAKAGANYTWNEVKNLTITTGPFNDKPDNLAGTQNYAGDNWGAWADSFGGANSAWEEDGFLIVFGQSTGPGAGRSATTVISNLVVIPEPASLALAGVGALMLIHRRRHA